VPQAVAYLLGGLININFGGWS